MRITLKPANGSTASNLAAAPKVSVWSFLDTLAGASSDAANESALTVAAAKGSSSDASDHGSEDPTFRPPIVASENDSDGAQEISSADSSICTSAAAIGSGQNRGAGYSRAASTIERPGSSAQPQSQSKASQPIEKQTSDSIQQAGDQDAAQQLVASIPAATLSDSSFCRSTQCAPASPDLTASATILRSNPNSIEQTASDEADASQSGVPPSASPATTDLSEAIAAELIEPTTFGVGSTFSQSTILTEGVDEGTLTNKTSQFKSSGATSTVNSTDAGSSKNLSAPPSSTNDHSAQAGSVSFQHVQGDSSTAAPLAIKSLESIATQTIPVSNHTAPVSPSLPHTASSTTDGLIKAQDSADAGAEQLERAGSTAAAGISTARLIQSMSESEMRIGMHSAEFGDISIRTSVSQQQLMAQISVDHSELGNAISAHLPSLESKLGSDFGVHASIELNQPGGSVTGGNGQPSHQNQKMTSQSVSPDSSALNAGGNRMPLPGQSLEVDNSRLDIRA